MSDEMREKLEDAGRYLWARFADGVTLWGDLPPHRRDNWIAHAKEVAALAAAPAEAQQPVAQEPEEWRVETREGLSRFCVNHPEAAAFYEQHGWTVTPLVPQRAPQPEEEG